jgi:DNA ligase D-like protein (predicted 3'-phosphoesterase)
VTAEQDPRFVIQHHLATADHYDVRLEIDGVLVSWAVPKGPSTDPKVRRLAKRVGDHDLDHAGYEGVLGPRRGGGVVQVWDHGTFRNVSREGATDLDAGAALARGHLSFVLNGEKLRGGYSLIRTRGSRDDWLLIKKNDADADAAQDPMLTRAESVLTGRTMDEIADDG